MSVDIETGLAIRIQGELGKYNTLPINTLIQIAKNLQDLVHAIVKADHQSDTLDINNFNIELSDFKPGSAIPEFKLTKRITPTITGVSGQRKDVVTKLNKILELSDSQDYSSIIPLFSDPGKRNEVVDKVFKFSNSFDNAPVQFGAIDTEGKFNKTFTLHKLSQQVKDQLLSSVAKPSKEAKTKEKGFAIIEISKTSKKTSQKIKNVVEKEEHSLAYSPTFIISGDKKYILNYPLHCVFDIDRGQVTIKNEMLDIHAVGEDKSSAVKDFAEEFDYLYSRLNSLSGDEIGKTLRSVKDAINLAVKSVEKW